MYIPHTEPVFIVYADTDEAVPFSCAEEAEHSFQNASLVVIPNDTHCYDNHLDQVLDAIRT